MCRRAAASSAFTATYFPKTNAGPGLVFGGAIWVPRRSFWMRERAPYPSISRASLYTPGHSIGGPAESRPHISLLRKVWGELLIPPLLSPPFLGNLAAAPNEERTANAAAPSKAWSVAVPRGPVGVSGRLHSWQCITVRCTSDSLSNRSPEWASD